jgi:hypothetical protein
MLETWLKKTREGMVEHGSKPFRWMRVFPPGVGIVMAVVAVVGGRLLWVNAQRPEHLQEITAAFGSVSLLNSPAQFNHDLNQFTYVATTDTRGVGLFLCETATGRKRLVGVQKDGSGSWHDEFDLRVWPWSPDDSSFIYSMRGSLFVCPVDTNSPSVELNLGTKTLATDVIWLNSLEFVWLEGETFCHAKRPQDGQWTIQRLPHQGRVSSLTAVDAHTIAWLQEDFICRLDWSQDLTGTNNPFVPLSSEAYALPQTNSLVLWLDASTLQLSNEAPVKVLADLSRRKNSAFINHNPPIFNAPGSSSALNGKGTIHFESGDSLLNATGLKTSKHLGITGSQPRSVFAVIRRNNGRQMLVNLGAPGEVGIYFGLCDQSDSLYLPAGWGAADSRFGRLPARWNILEATYDGASQGSYVNGSSLGKKPVALKTADKSVEIGLRTGSERSLTNAVASDGDFAELLVYDQVLSFTEQRQVEDYLSAKWFGSRPLSASCSFIWLDPKMTGLTGFNYSRETGRLLISRAENGRDTLWRMETGKGSLGEPTQILQGRFLRDAQWTGPREFAYTSREIGHQGLQMADLSGKQNAPLFQRGNIGWFKVTPDQKKVLFWGNVSNEPAAGIWQYDIGSGDLRSIIPGSEHPSAYAKKITPYNGFIRLPSGRNVYCTIYPPANFNRHKKYPLVIGDTLIADPIHGQWLQSGIAACGAYVVFVNRNSWYGEIDKWEENVRAVHKYLKRDPCIDPERVYLFGASAETRYMSECLERTPGLWHGAIFLNPSSLPDFSKSLPLQGRPKILISAGSEEREDERLKHFQQDAVQSGVLADIIIHPSETHRMVGTAGKLARLQAIKHFIFEE